VPKASSEFEVSATGRPEKCSDSKSPDIYI
jgi:hypothetical protein